MAGGSAEPGASRPRTRRDFLKLAGAAAGLGALNVAGVWYLKGLLDSALVSSTPLRIPAGSPAPWETSPGVVDYGQVPQDLSGPAPHVLKVAQWFDYWPGSFVADFASYMQQTYGKTVNVQVSIYTSNAELLKFLLAGQTFDVIFPTSHMVGLLDSLGGVFNMNPDWVPNIVNLDPAFRNVPAAAPYDHRTDGDTIALPYFWGTTGVAWRIDKIPAADVQTHGMDFLWMDSFTPSDTRFPTVDLKGKMRMLAEERDVLAWGFKKAGWEAQKAQGGTPTGLVPPDGVQWTSNETDPARVSAAAGWLQLARPNLFDFNSTEDAASLVAGASIVNQAWSGDIMYAMRPDQSVPYPIGYEIPVQGSDWWIDTIVIPSTARNLWAAHEFANFIHSVADPWPENITLTAWNLSATPNRATWEYFLAHPFPNGWNMSEDPTLYPNQYALDQWKLVDLLRSVPASTLLDDYDPAWYGLTSG